MLFKIKALVLNMGLGERVITKYINAQNGNEAAETFIKTYLTIEIMEVSQC